MDPKGKGMVVNDNEKEYIFNEPRDDKKKVKSRASTKYATSSDEDNSSDDEENLFALFANLNMQQKEKKYK